MKLKNETRNLKNKFYPLNLGTQMFHFSLHLLNQSNNN